MLSMIVRCEVTGWNGKPSAHRECEAQQQRQRGARRRAHATGCDLVGHQQRGKQRAGHGTERHECDPAAAEQESATMQRN